MMPGGLETAYARALAAFRAGDNVLCAAEAAAILARDPAYGPAWLLRAVSAPDGEAVRQVAAYSAACRHAPLDSDSWFNRGVYHEERQELTAAIDCYRRTLAIDPLHLGALINGTQLIRVHEHFEEAIELARRLQRLAPDHPAGYANEAIALQYVGELERADAVFVEAIARSSDPSHLQWEHHFSLLARERFAEAWQGYETRFACGRYNGVEDMAFVQPRWDGSCGGHVLVYGEQGLGDQLMFSAALPDLLAKVDKASLAVHPALVALFAASFPDIAVHSIEHGNDPIECAAVAARAGADRPIDSVLPLGSLMTHFRNSRESFRGAPYLRPSDDARAFWRKLERQPRGPFRLGLCWASNPAPDRFFSARRARHKTMPLEAMLPLARLPGVEASAITNVPLDAFDADREATSLIADRSADLTNLDRTAALLEQMDLLVTVDTGVAHLAGALGVPVWILLHTSGDARWGLPGSETSYWYASARLFWQSHAGDWNDLIGRIVAELKVQSGRHADCTV